MDGCHPGFGAISGLCLRHFCSVARCVGSFLNTSSGAGGRRSFLQRRNLVMERFKMWRSQGQPLNQLQAVAQEPLSPPHSGKGPFQVWSGWENFGLGVCAGYWWMDRRTEDLGLSCCSAINSDPQSLCYSFSLANSAGDLVTQLCLQRALDPNRWEGQLRFLTRILDPEDLEKKTCLGEWLSFAFSAELFSRVSESDILGWAPREWWAGWL